jgi:hypothetical protein
MSGEIDEAKPNAAYHLVRDRAKERYKRHRDQPAHQHNELVKEPVLCVHLETATTLSTEQAD